MGLDISVYRNTELIDTLQSVDDWEAKYYFSDKPIGERVETEYIYDMSTTGYADRGFGLVTGGVYKFDDRYDFRAGSYGGYNWWRDELSKLMLGVPASKVWEMVKKYPTWEQLPFVLLINFSDCEGYIGLDACKKLARDFAEYRHIAEQHTEIHWREQYAKWLKAFEMASDNGFVSFH